ncbi:MAG TPA: hypothetical protein VM243_14730 [Phycisphaerae bacterium]|nr:hypothetical protein [Phycisphaerae bacterium]
MIAASPHYCPVCEELLNRENCTIAHLIDRDRLTLLCEHCGIGWEIETYIDGELFALDFRQRTEPDSFRRFVARLEDSRAA